MKSVDFRKFALSILVALLMAVTTVAAQEPAEGAEEGKDEVSQEKIAEAIETIEAAENAREAGKAYSGIARKAKENGELHAAYISKLIEFGNVNVAFYASMQLTNAEPDNDLGWRVLGYCQAERRDYAAAINALSQAAKLVPNDEAAMENLGQLMAHLDNDESPPKVSPEAQEIIDAHRGTWAGNDAYNRGYEKILAGYEAYSEKEAELTEEIESTKAEGEEKDREITSLERELERVIDRRRHYQDLEGDDNLDEEPPEEGEIGLGDSTYSEQIKECREREREIRAEIEELKDEIVALGKKYRTLSRELDRLPYNRKEIVRDANAEFAFVEPGVVASGQQSAETQAEQPADDSAEQQDGQAPQVKPVIIDNEDSPGLIGQGQWHAMAGDGVSHGPTFLHDNNTGKGANIAGFNANLPQAGEYEVYLFYPQANYAATNVPVDITHAGGTDTVTADQRNAGGAWIKLGTYTFAKGGGVVTIRTDNTDGYVFVDAVKFELVAAQAQQSEQDQGEKNEQQDQEQARQDEQGEGDAIVFDNDDGNLMGQGNWYANAGNGGSQGQTFIHDNNTDKGANVAGFSANLSEGGQYDVYMFCPAVDGSATNVPVDVTHAQGTTRVTVDQRNNGGKWVHLGTYTFAQGGGVVAVRTDNTDGFVLVDAVKFVPVAESADQQPAQ